MKHRPLHRRAGIRVAVLAVSLATLSGTAAAADRSEHIGIFSGMLLGALFGGPPGAIAGAVGGGLAGGAIERSHTAERQAGEITRLRTELSQARARAAAVEQGRTLVASAAPVAVAASRPAVLLEASVQFRTASADLEPHFAGQLRLLAAFADQFPETVVSLHGYADPRGRAPANLQLSAARVQAVRSALVAAGVAETRIRSEALGEAQPLYGDHDREGRDFERRVLIRIDDRESQS